MISHNQVDIYRANVCCNKESTRMIVLYYTKLVGDLICLYNRKL